MNDGRRSERAGELRAVMVDNGPVFKLDIPQATGARAVGEEELRDMARTRLLTFFSAEEARSADDRNVFMNTLAVKVRALLLIFK